MAKYDVVFKMKIVTEYLEGMNGYKTLGRKYGLTDTKQIRKWVNQFQQYGRNGLERKQTNKKYTSQFKMDVIHYRKRTGASLLETANTFGIHEPSLIRAWDKKFQEGGVEALSSTKGRPPKMDKKEKRSYNKKALTRKQELEQENKLLRIENEYLKKLRAFQQNPDLLGKHKP